MTERLTDEQFVETTLELLRAGDGAPSDGDTARLRRSRAAALEQAEHRSDWLRWGALATASVAVLAVGLHVFQGAPPQQQPLPGLEHLELLAGSETLQFYEQLEFLDWLEHSRHVQP